MSQWNGMFAMQRASTGQFPYSYGKRGANVSGRPENTS